MHGIVCYRFTLEVARIAISVNFSKILAAAVRDFTKLFWLKWCVGCGGVGVIVFKDSVRSAS